MRKAREGTQETREIGARKRKEKKNMSSL